MVDIHMIGLTAMGNASKWYEMKTDWVKLLYKKISIHPCRAEFNVVQRKTHLIMFDSSE